MISKSIERLHHVRLDSDSTVMDELFRLQQSKQLQELQLLNYYKEVPIKAVAKNLRLFENSLFCKTNDVQARIIEFANESILKSENLQYHIHAAAHYNPDTREVAFSDFSYVNVLAERRETVRVRMHIPLAVVIEAGHRKFKGRLIDLSLDACAIDVANHELDDRKNYYYLNIEMPVKTGGQHIKTRVMVNLLKVNQKVRHSHCVFLFKHDRNSESQIGKIIALRQGEILRELK